MKSRFLSCGTVVDVDVVMIINGDIDAFEPRGVGGDLLRTGRIRNKIPQLFQRNDNVCIRIARPEESCNEVVAIGIERLSLAIAR